MGYAQDLDVILDAAKILAEVTFVLVGDGVEKSRLVAKAESMGLANVTWMPMQPRKSYADILFASDVTLDTLKPSVASSVVPSKIVASMAAGIPVVAALDPAGDAPRLIEEAGAGICVPPGDAGALVAAIAKLRGDSDTRGAMGARGGRVLAERHLSAESAAERYEAIVESVIRGAGQSLGSRENL